jgi:hypothetical protein
MFFEHTRRRALRAGPVTLAVCAGLLAAAPAQAATYPQPGGSSFGSGTEGWTGVQAECSALSGTVVCEQENVHDPGDGNPPGSIVARTSVIANAAGLLRGDSTWRSPAFVAQGSSGAGVLEYDRRLDVGGLLTLAPEASVDVLLVNESAGTVQQLGSERLTQTDDTFARSRLAVPAGTLASGSSYRIELRSSTSTSVAQVGVLGGTELEYDNVSLSVSDRT